MTLNKYIFSNDIASLTLHEKTLESFLDSKEINPSILKDISPEYSLEGLMLKLKLHYFDTKSRLIGKDPDVRKD